MDSQLEILKQLIDQGNNFTFKNFSYPNKGGYLYDDVAGEERPEGFEWTTRSLNLVTRLVTAKSPAHVQITQAIDIATEDKAEQFFKKKRETILRALQNTYTAVASDAFGELRSEQGRNISPAISNKVFVVHGHDQELKNDVERFIHSIGLEPIVLHRQVDAGSTIIEKFEKNSDVGFAIILLTPDEMAYAKDQEPMEDNERTKEWRARPNVIFEFGYFVGKLERKRVCCIHKGEVAIPSDLHGLVYKKVIHSIDEQGMFLMRELKAAGYKIAI